MQHNIDATSHIQAVTKAGRRNAIVAVDAAQLQALKSSDLAQQLNELSTSDPGGQSQQDANAASTSSNSQCECAITLTPPRRPKSIVFFHQVTTPASTRDNHTTSHTFSIDPDRCCRSITLRRTFTPPASSYTLVVCDHNNNTLSVIGYVIRMVSINARIRYKTVVSSESSGTCLLDPREGQQIFTGRSRQRSDRIHQSIRNSWHTCTSYGMLCTSKTRHDCDAHRLMRR